LQKVFLTSKLSYPASCFPANLRRLHRWNLDDVDETGRIETVDSQFLLELSRFINNTTLGSTSRNH